MSCAACGILVLHPGIEPGGPEVRALSPNHWTAREFPRKRMSEYNITPELCYEKWSILAREKLFYSYFKLKNPKD